MKLFRYFREFCSKSSFHSKKKNMDLSAVLNANLKSAYFTSCARQSTGSQTCSMGRVLGLCKISYDHFGCLNSHFVMSSKVMRAHPSLELSLHFGKSGNKSVHRQEKIAELKEIFHVYAFMVSSTSFHDD